MRFKTEMENDKTLQVTQGGDPELYLWYLIKFLKVRTMRFNFCAKLCLWYLIKF